MTGPRSDATMRFSAKLLQAADEVERQIDGRLREIDLLAEQNQWKVIEAFRRHRVSSFHFAGSTGYGYHDAGRETLDRVFADVVGAEAAIVRPQIVSGTHAIAVALFGVLRPGDELVSVGPPYDTLRTVLAGGPGTGSLADWGIRYAEVPLDAAGRPDWAALRRVLTPKTKVVALQRSRGYGRRSPLSVRELGEIADFVHGVQRDAVVFVDNCYGEFTEPTEPTEAGADLMAGSLIKNPGGGLAPTGGYIAGKAHWVRQAAERLTVPGVGGEVGPTLDLMRSLFQGLYFAPHCVGQALKGAVFAAALCERLGLETSPRWDEPRTDLIQAIRLPDAEALVAFVRGIQEAGAVDSHVAPEPEPMPGYRDAVVMAAGTFVQGATLELSADAPLREPYEVYFQGGLTYAHAKLGILTALQRLMDEGRINVPL